jgi:ribosomal protein S2
MIFYLNNFVNYTIHIGHKAINSLLLSSWFFYKLRKKIWIINIIKTIIFLKITFKYIAYLINNKLPIWFINLEITRELIFRKFATISGEFFCTRVWVRGLLSNYKNIQESLSKYNLRQYIIKKENKNILIKNW